MIIIEVEQTTNYRFQYSRLEFKLKRFIDEAIELIKDNPREYQGKIVKISKDAKKKVSLYRFRLPGAFILYLVHEEEPKVTLCQIKVLR